MWANQTPWEMSGALAFIRRLDLHIKPDYHLALCGSILTVGTSKNDLDLIVYPNKLIDNNYHEIVSLLKSFGLRRILDHRDVWEFWVKNQKGECDRKVVEVWRYKDARVDIIYWV